MNYMSIIIDNIKNILYIDNIGNVARSCKVLYRVKWRKYKYLSLYRFPNDLENFTK